MAFKLDFSTDNAAFYEGAGEESECGRILRKVADRLESGELDGKVFDANGNTVGSFELTGK